MSINREPQSILKMSFETVIDPTKLLDMVAWEDRGRLYKGVVAEFVEAGELPATDCRRIDYRYVVGLAKPKPGPSVVVAVPDLQYVGCFGIARWVAVADLIYASLSLDQATLRTQLHLWRLREKK